MYILPTGDMEIALSIFRYSLSTILHVWNQGTEKGCSQHCFTFVRNFKVFYFWVNCKTIELSFLPTAAQERKGEGEKKRKKIIMKSPGMVEWKGFHIMSTSLHLDAHDIWM